MTFNSFDGRKGSDWGTTAIHWTKWFISTIPKQIYSYSDIIKITNNFTTIVGKGGFGTVYLGYIEDTPVAVKMLSSSSVRGYQQFQTEVTLFNHIPLSPSVQQ